MSLPFWVTYYFGAFFYEIAVTFWVLVLLTTLAAIANTGYFVTLRHEITIAQATSDSLETGSQKPSYNWNAASSSANTLIVLNFFIFAFLIAVLYFVGSCVFY